MEKEDGIGQLPQSARQITATIEHLSVTLVNVQTEIASLKETLAIERQQDRDLMKKIYSRLKLMSSNEAPTVTSRVTTPSSTPDIPAVPDQIIIPNIPATPARPPASRPTIPVTPATPVTPVMFEARYLSAPSPGHLLLGGDQGLPRNVSWYKDILKQVSWKKKSGDDDNGRLLCMKLLRAEFSQEDLASKNVTGFTRNRGDHKRVPIEQLDTNILTAIFHQAKHQFPSFNQWYTDTKCATVKELNNICQKARTKALVVDQRPIQHDDAE